MKAVVIHSGGMDSSICLKLAINEYGKENVHSLSFDYNQRHKAELNCAAEICRDWGVAHSVVDINYLSKITTNALVSPDVEIKTVKETKSNEAPNVLVVGRNGLMVRIASIFAHNIGANSIYTGILGLDNTSHFRDCSREYMDKMQEIMRIDTGNNDLEIVTPLVALNKVESLGLGMKLNVLEYLLEKTISCYKGIPHEGCGECPACEFRNKAIKDLLVTNKSLSFSYKSKI